ncbi:hypothetical protein QTG54_008167 [Skeletonema marinoi]|uniref:Uncharacterized protein n=1 Tax=Skeletonema marinoi TaxID=267567 RepID=A0AAD8Y9H9_9STRA|nr:hypothetical protein QTG54_008167 [Skeletonema marinoi]
MKCIFLKLTAFAMLATASASGVYASSESDEPSSTTPQSLRGSFLDENEDADWWGGWGNDLSKCTSNCHCYVGSCDQTECRSNCGCNTGGGGACKRGHNEGDSEDVGIDQSFSGEDEEEYDTGDFEHDEDEELDEADAFAQA